MKRETIPGTPDLLTIPWLMEQNLSEDEDHRNLSDLGVACVLINCGLSKPSEKIFDAEKNMIINHAVFMDYLILKYKFNGPEEVSSWHMDWAMS